MMNENIKFDGKLSKVNLKYLKEQKGREDEKKCMKNIRIHEMKEGLDL